MYVMLAYTSVMYWMSMFPHPVVETIVITVCNYVLVR